MIMIIVKIIEGLLNIKNKVYSLNNCCNDNIFSQNYRRYLTQKTERNRLNKSSNDNDSSQIDKKVY